MQIVYGYCSEDEATDLLGRFVEQGDFIDAKKLGHVGGEHMAFAALLPLTERLSFPFYCKGVHLVAIQKQAQYSAHLTPPISCNAQKKRYRKLKNAEISPRNWKQHMSRNRGLKFVTSSLVS
ncbi:hypothetical protein [Vibrio sp. R78045]